MIIFIDESGIHKKIDFSVFVLIYVRSSAYPGMEKQICDLENKAGIKYFHWSESSWKVKEKFICCFLKMSFKAKIMVVENPINPVEISDIILVKALTEKNIKFIFIDGKKPKWYAKKIKRFLRNNAISVRKIKTVRSEACSGIRLADLVAGLARWHFDNKNSNKTKEYFKMLQKKSTITFLQKRKTPESPGSDDSVV